MLHGRIDELVDFRERYNFVELAVNFTLAHPQDGAAEVSVLAAGELRVEAGADLE